MHYCTVTLSQIACPSISYNEIASARQNMNIKVAAYVNA